VPSGLDNSKLKLRRRCSDLYRLCTANVNSIPFYGQSHKDTRYMLTGSNTNLRLCARVLHMLILCATIISFRSQRSNVKVKNLIDEFRESRISCWPSGSHIFLFSFIHSLCVLPNGRSFLSDAKLLRLLLFLSTFRNYSQCL